METTIREQPASAPSSCRTRRHRLPPTMRVLYVANRRRLGGWLVEAFAEQKESEIQLEEVTGSSAAVARLRVESFHALLVAHDREEIDALELIEAYRAAGTFEPIVVMGDQSEQEMAVRCFEKGADAYVCVNTVTTEQLLWIVGRAILHHEQVRENRRLRLSENQRLQREHEEAEMVIRQQRRLIAMLQTSALENLPSIPKIPDLPTSEAPGEEPECLRPPPLPDSLLSHYRELLRTYVIMGSGNLSGELHRLSELLVLAGVSASETMAMHLHALEELLRGLGARSTRHVMTRADLLILEILAFFADDYRSRYRERCRPAVQQWLPGFEDFA
jgi:DNA-binding response OmpR family regulator